MLSEAKRFAFLSGNTLKFIAAAAMVCDHAGLILFPDTTFLRAIGRLAFPIFAFFISEGAKYTKSRLRYLLTLAAFAAVIQTAYFAYSRSTEMNIMVTLTLSVCVIYTLDLFKVALFSKGTSPLQKLLMGVLFVGTVAAACVLDKLIDLDYGFAGCMLPVFASLFTSPRKEAPSLFLFLDTIPVRALAMGVGLLALCVGTGGTQYYTLLSLPLLLLYSGKRGQLRTKYFFYVFYPAHLILIEATSLLMEILSH